MRLEDPEGTNSRKLKEVNRLIGGLFGRAGAQALLEAVRAVELNADPVGITQLWPCWKPTAPSHPLYPSKDFLVTCSVSIDPVIFYLSSTEAGILPDFVRNARLVQFAQAFTTLVQKLEEKCSDVMADFTRLGFLCLDVRKAEPNALEFVIFGATDKRKDPLLSCLQKEQLIAARDDISKALVKGGKLKSLCDGTGTGILTMITLDFNKLISQVGCSPASSGV